MRKTLTKAQDRALEFLRDYVRDRGYPPSIREMKEGLGLASHSAIQNCLSALEKKGYIRRSSKARAIEFCESLRASEPAVLPLVGHIRAGAPHPAIEDVEEYIAVDRSFTVGGGNFLLKAEGDSMVEAHIQDGDYVVVRPQSTANNGEIVAAMVDDEATVKRFYKEGNEIRLRPANPAYKDIVIEPGRSEVSIVGKVVAVLRSL
ncbi:MAG: transcriptional repressor LexA [Planctomycetota bacterium]|jgi:repressor LexA